MGITGLMQKNNGTVFWEILEGILGKIISIIGSSLVISLIVVDSTNKVSFTAVSLSSLKVSSRLFKFK